MRSIFITRLAGLTTVLTALILAAPAVGQQAEDIGDYLVHYNTLNTNLLSPDVAGAYGIQRSGSRAMLNITLIRKSEDGLGTAASGRVEATAVNLTGQRRELDLAEVRDQDAIYYIATFRIHNEERLNFQVQVQPEGSNRTHEFSFRQQFYTD